jgi:hypothetical protein
MNVFDITSMSSPVVGIQIEAGKVQSLKTSNIQILMADTNITVGKTDAAIILPLKSAPITTTVVNSKLVYGKVYSIQHNVIKFLSD